MHATKSYFDNVAENWDQLRAGYFTEGVRGTAIRKAYLRPEMAVADVGGGSGFMTAGLAPLVSQVHLVDGSEAMLAAARRNLAGFENVTFHHADGLSLPFQDTSLDAVFANMYLHHCADPLAAIQEMKRVLKPGGRLMITDLDAHPYAWLKDEMADVWMGFERPQVREWLEAAGLVNVLLECTGEPCCAKTQDESVQDGLRQAEISIFLATGTRRISGVTEAVREGYHARAESGSCSCMPADTSCCSTDLIQIADAPSQPDVIAEYTPLDLAGVPAEAAEISLGCGNPTAMAAIQPGETVLDIGSGGGIDAFIAARQVGPTGKVIGVDMTQSMLERARRTAAKAGYDQVEFRFGHAQALPVEDGSVDVILSNCVINLTDDKGKVFREAQRALKLGGRLEISDVVTDMALPLDLRQDPANWASCVYGALPEAEYLDLVKQAGFEALAVRRSPAGGLVSGVRVYSLTLSARKAG
jgi:ubiquinone/menaquinone biosynthesis C-methylase UbiE